MSKAKETPESFHKDCAAASEKDMAQEQDKTVVLKESEHQKLLAEVAEYKDRYVRLYAEF